MVERRIEEVTQSGFEGKTAYKLKSSSSSLSRSNHMYTMAQIDKMQMHLGEMINFWKYDEGGADGPLNTKFFEGTPNPYSENFETYNKTKTLADCG